MKVPCQEIVWDILPAIRAAIVRELVNQGASQLEAASLLGLAPSAISQYLSGKRGYRIEFEDKVKESIHELARDLKEGKVENLIDRICIICKQLRESPGAVCEEKPGTQIRPDSGEN
ncbi:MAG: transcriptional regulator [Methanoregulaceae archaeon]|nr:transcriptional regulator [Methanoregulaceae archaeon]